MAYHGALFLLCSSMLNEKYEIVYAWATRKKMPEMEKKIMLCVTSMNVMEAITMKMPGKTDSLNDKTVTDRCE